MEDRLIRRIYSNKKTKQMLICIPKGSGFEDKDYVEVKKI